MNERRLKNLRVDAFVVVHPRPGVTIAYRPGVYLAPSAHIESIVAQGRGVRLAARGALLRGDLRGTP